MSKITDIVEDLRNIEELTQPAQEQLVSGTTIKTINGDSLLGSGDITTPTTTVNDTLTSTSTTEALTANQGKVLKDLVDTKQDLLVSGTNIMTINGNTILGSGDIEIDTSDKLSLSGGTMTGAITGLKETSVAMGANNIDMSLGNLFTKTISGATTLTVSNVPASGTVGYFILKLTNGGAGAVTYPAGTKWSKGTAPTLTASGVDLLRFITIDGGTRWEASRIQEDSK